MIVKTGANYQAEGGYIEAAVVDNKIVATINDQTKEYPYFETSVGETSIVPITICKSENAADISISCALYQRYSIESGSDVYDYRTVALTTTPITGSFGFSNPAAIFLNAPAGTGLKLANGSKDCEIVKRAVGENKYLIITGPNPVAIIDVE